MVRRKLTVEPIEDSTFCVIGIASKQKDYMLAQCVNIKLGFGFIRLDNLIYFGKNEKIETCFYHDFDDQNEYKRFLVKNYSSAKYLIPSLKQFQYLIIFSKQIEDDQKKQFLKQIRSIQNVLFVSVVSESQHKDLPQLFEEIELHLLSITKKENEQNKEKLSGARKSRVKAIPTK